jgi:hypothetical protein
MDRLRAPRRAGGCLAGLVWLVWATATPSAAAVLTTARFALRFADGPRAASLRTAPGGEELLNTANPGAGFYLTRPGGARTLLSQVALDGEGRLTARSADGAQAVVWQVRATERYVALRLVSLEGIPAQRGMALHFEINGSPRLRVTELDYMTRVEQHPAGPRVHCDELWHRTPGEPLGGFALFVRDDEADEDETLLHIWAGEQVAHPKVAGEWTLDRARAWLAEWQRTFADRSQMILEGESVAELRAALPWAQRARIKEIYLFTQTWRTDNFWPGGNGNVHVNRKVFPRGEDDLKAFGDEVAALGMRLNLHYVSGGLGRTDPTYVGARPDRRLAGWVRAKLAKPAGKADGELVVQPPAGASYPPDLPHFFAHNHWRIDDELVVVGTCEPAADGTWRLKGCRRGQFLTQAADHAAGADSQGLVVAYGQNYVPDNDSTLLDEVAAGYAALINRCRVAHTEYDGAEIHCYNGRWGYLKFATRVYQQVDHPVTAHDSGGSAPRCNYEYRFHSTRRLLRGTCSFTHGNWSAPVQLASPGRVASTLLDANFVLSQGHLGGALGVCRPEPMFAVSDRVFRAHGLTDRLFETLLAWKAVSGLLTDEQRARLDAGFGRPTGQRMPEASRHVVSRFVQTVRKAPGGYQIVPVCVLTRERGDIRWQQGQEHGAVSPRQFVQPGDTLTLENPLAAQPARFIVRVLWAFDPRGPSVPLVPGRGQAAGTGVDLFTTGNAPGAGPRAAVPNLRLQPALGDLRQPADGPLRTAFAAEGAGLRLTAENPSDRAQWADPKLLASWGAGFDLTGRRGLGLRVTGDGSGALLLFAISGRDYVTRIDFTGPREIQIPHGEVAWASGDWGWRMDTKRVNYARQHGCRLGFGFLGPRGKASVLVEDLTALAEVPAVLENPVFRTGAGTLTVAGKVASGQYLQYEGGPTAQVYDENWHKLADLPVTLADWVMPSGAAPIGISAAGTGPRPWLDVQFLTEGEAMVVAEGK